MHVEAALELDQQLEEDAVAVPGVGEQAAELPEVGLLLAGGRAQRRRVDRAGALGEDPEAAAAEDRPGIVLDPREVLGALDEDVGDRECRGRGRARDRGPRREPPRPRSCAGCRSSGRSRRPRRRRCRPGGASSEARRSPAAPARAMASRRGAPRHRSRRRPCPRRSAGRRVAGREARASSARLGGASLAGPLTGPRSSCLPDSAPSSSGRATGFPRGPVLPLAAGLAEPGIERLDYRCGGGPRRAGSGGIGSSPWRSRSRSSRRRAAPARRR